MAWTVKARQWALWKRVRNRESLQSGCVCVVRRVADRGGGLGRAARILNDFGRPTMRGGTARGCRQHFRWTRKQVHRLAQDLGFDLARGAFVPGVPTFDVTCGRCGDSLKKQPWCQCLPRPAGGIFDWFREDGMVPATPPRPSKGGSRRLAKWRESLKKSGT